MKHQWSGEVSTAGPTDSGGSFGYSAVGQESAECAADRLADRADARRPADDQGCNRRVVVLVDRAACDHFQLVSPGTITGGFP